MKTKFLASLMLTMLITMGAMAQEKSRKERDPEEVATRMTEKMADRLGLNAEQKEAVYESNLRMAQARKAGREEMKEAAESHEAEMEDILTKAQYAEYLELKTALRERMREGRGRREQQRNDR